MRKKNNYTDFEGGFTPEDASKNDQRRTSQRSEKWHGESEQEKGREPFQSAIDEGLSKKHASQPDSTSTAATIKDARGNIQPATEKERASSFQKNICKRQECKISRAE